MASLPKLEEVIRAPPPKTTPSSSDSSSSSDREKSRREGASPESRHTLEGPEKQHSRQRNRSPGSAHDQSGSFRKHCSSRRSKGRYAERSREKAAASHKRRRRDVRSRSLDVEFRSDSSDDDRRHRHETLSRGKDSKEWQERPKSSAKEGSHRRDGHRHKRHKHKCVLGTFIIPEFPGVLGYARRYMLRCMHEDPTGIHAAAMMLGWRVYESVFFIAAQEGGEHQGGAALESQQAHRRAEVQRGGTQEEADVRE